MAGTLDKIAPINKVLAVDAVLLVDGKIDIRTMEFRRKRGSLIFGDRKSMVLECIQDLNTDVPILLTLSGHGVLLKSIPSVRQEKILSSCLPNATEADFLYEYSEAQDAMQVVLCRQSLVDQVLSEFKSHGVFVVSISLGLHDLTVVTEVLEQETICSRTYCLPKAQESDGSRQEGHRLDVDGDIIPGDYVSCFAHAMSFVTGRIQHLDSVAEQKLEAQHKLLFRRAGMAMVAFLLGVMSVNLFAHSSYQEEFDRLSQQHQSNKSMLRSLDTVQREISERTELVAESGLTETSKISEYTDRIGELIPKEITLSHLAVAPVVGRPKNNTRIEFNSDEILINGESSSVPELNRWMNALRKLSFVDELELVGYEKKGQRQGKFSIVLQVK